MSKINTKKLLNLLFVVPMFVIGNLAIIPFAKGPKEQTNSLETLIENKLEINSVVADVKSVTINYSFLLEDTSDVQLYVYDANGVVRGFQSELIGTITINNLKANQKYSNWKVVLNKKGTIIDTKYLPDFVPISNHEISAIEVTKINPASNMVMLEYNIATNIQNLDYISIEVKDQNGVTLISNLESKLNGVLVVNNLTAGSQYSGWTIVAKSTTNITVSASAFIDDFVTQINSQITNLQITNIKTTANYARISYIATTNFASEDLIVSVVDASGNVLYQKNNFEASGNIDLMNLDENKWYTDLTLVVTKRNDVSINKAIPISPFKTKLENPFIETIMIDFMLNHPTIRGVEFLFTVNGNIDGEDYIVEMLDSTGRLIGSGEIGGRNKKISQGNVVAKGLAPNTYTKCSLRLTYKYDATCSKTVFLNDFTIL